MYLFAEPSEGAEATPRRPGFGALAFLDEGSLVIGSRGAVESTIANRADGAASLRANDVLMGLLEQVRPGSSFWLVGDETLLAQLPKAIPVPGGASGVGMELPALEGLVVSGELAPLLSVHATGETADAAAATSLADVLRGFTALVTLQASQRPELKELVSAISVTTEASRVHVNVRLPYELLESLLPGGAREGADASPEVSSPAPEDARSQ
jgi:hypothetical protein